MRHTTCIVYRTPTNTANATTTANATNSTPTPNTTISSIPSSSSLSSSSSSSCSTLDSSVDGGALRCYLSAEDGNSNSNNIINNSSSNIIDRGFGYDRSNVDIEADAGRRSHRSDRYRA